MYVPIARNCHFGYDLTWRLWPYVTSSWPWNQPYTHISTFRLTLSPPSLVEEIMTTRKVAVAMHCNLRPFVSFVTPVVLGFNRPIKRQPTNSIPQPPWSVIFTSCIFSRPNIWSASDMSHMCSPQIWYSSVDLTPRTWLHILPRKRSWKICWIICTLAADCRILLRGAMAQLKFTWWEHLRRAYMPSPRLLYIGRST